LTDTTITRVLARRVWDSRGRPTVEAEVHLASGAKGRAIAPAGASRGTREAIDLRDGGPRFGGMDVLQAVAGVNGAINARLSGLAAADQAAVDAALIALDGTPNKAALGGNATVAVSLACLHAAALGPLWQHVAQLYGTSPTLPLPEIQIFGGGAHAGRRVDIQDFMVMVPGARTLAEVFEITAGIYAAAGSILAEKGLLRGVADEGGWWPEFTSNEEALDFLVRAIEQAGEIPGDRVVISLDVAASEFGHGGQYRLALDDRTMDSDGLAERLGQWIDRYPIASIEDPLAEDDLPGLAAFTRAFGDRVQIIGDDALVTNAALVRQAAAAGACNALLLKVNQIGTVTEAVAAWREAQAAGWPSVVSARSGETEDTSIVDLAIGLGAGQLKVGSFARSERMAKWNACIRAEDRNPQLPFVRGGPLAGTWWGRAQSLQPDPMPSAAGSSPRQ
jgi:enolase